ncbi:hypothetical protein A4A49_27034 [Nicotiana attenuata]|uniref:Uncharacterized protein n=1 Tax=Nicotiana attenuata TaxID=49451 RepID=A0A1J6IEZ2_NICAT|nr:hypothetical protein A4A49_27034 [Nicotiana attenuata]
MGCDDDLLLSFWAISTLHALRKNRPVSWRGDPCMATICKPVSAAMACVCFLFACSWDIQQNLSPRYPSWVL